MSGQDTLCLVSDIEDGEGRGFALGDGRDIFVVREGGAVYGYVNACPHQGTPLDWTPDTFISDDTGQILCATHGAQFEIADGACVSGPCAGDRLTPVPLRVDGSGRISVRARAADR